MPAGMTTMDVKDGIGVAQKMLAAEDASGNNAIAHTWVDDEGNHVSADPFGIRVGNGEIAGYDTIDKFGHNHAVGSTLVPIAYGGVWPTPQAASATTLRIKAGGNPADDVAGLGAREIRIYGIDATGAEVSEDIVTAGASASANTVNSYMRIWRAFVTKSGSYASPSIGSHAANIVIEDSAGSADWLTIPYDTIDHGQSQVASYTVPNGKKAYIASFTFGIDSTKTPDLFLFQRQNILEAAAPYTARRVIRIWEGISGHTQNLLRNPLGPFPANTDLGAMALISTGSAKVSVTMSILQMDA